MPDSNLNDATLTPTDARKQLESAGTLQSIHWLVISLSLALTFFAWYYSDSQRKSRQQMQFDREADQVKALLVEQMVKYEDALWGGVAFVDSHGGEVSADQWTTFASSLQIEERHPGINGMGVIYSIARDDSDSFVADQRVQRPEFKVFPSHAREALFPITYIVPTEGNEEALGLDIAHETNRYEAAVKAGRTGLAQITGPIQLVQDDSQTPGFLFYAPFYRVDAETSSGDGPSRKSTAGSSRTFAGMVYAPFVVKKLTKGVLDEELRHVGIRLMDDSAVLYDEHQESEPDYDPEPLFTKTTTLSLYGREWTFDIRSAQSFRIATDDNQPITILVGGLLIDSLLVYLFLSISRNSRKALNYADAMTTQLERSNSMLEDEVAERGNAEAALKESFESLQESRTIIRGLADQSFNLIGLLSVDGTLLEANATALRIIDTPAAAVINQPFWETPWWSHSEEARDRLKLAIQAAANGVEDRFESTHMTADGEVAYIDFSIKPIRDDSGRVAFLVPEGRDITLQKQREAELHQLLGDLATSNQELEQFAYVASHDLQEPLRKVIAFCELLDEDYGDRFDEDGKQYLAFAVDGAKRMRQLVKDLLTYSRLQSQSQPPHIIDVADAVELALGNLEIAVSESSAVVDVGPMPQLYADSNKLTQLFQNLLSNAIKYRRPHVAPKISVSCDEIDGHWQFSIIDNGIGIEEEHQERVFGIFKRLHNREQYSGTGIGLALCKRIVEQLNGRIWATGNSHGGSSLHFTIPKRKSTYEGTRSEDRDTALTF